jgi:AsmA protein
MKQKKVLVALAAGTVALAVAGAVVVRSLIDPDHVRQVLERQASSRLGQPVTIGRAELSWWPRAGITLTDVVVGQPGAVTLARTELSTAMRALLGRRIEDAEVSVHDSELDLPLLLATLDRLSGGTSPGGRAAPGANATAARSPEPVESSSSGVTLVNVRAIELQNVRIRAGSRAAVINLESALDGDRLDIESASVESNVTSLKATGRIESLANRKGQLSITAETLDLDGLVVFAQEFARQAMPATSAAAAAKSGGRGGPLDLTLAITAVRGSAANVPFEQLAATARIEPGGVSIEPMTARRFSGGIESAIRLDLSGVEPAIDVKGALKSLDMTRLTEFAGQPGAISGTLSGSFSANGRGTDPAAALSRARGQGLATITDGAVKGLQLVRPIVLAFGRPDAVQPTEGGERFSRLAANFNLAAGVVTLSNLVLESRDVQTEGAGTLAIASRSLDIRANARLSQELTAQAGRDLVRYTVQDGRVTVPVTITGPLDAPQVGVNIAGVAERAIQNELKRRTESAIRDLFKRKRPQD